MARSGSRVPLALALGVALAGAVIAVAAVLVTATGTASDRTMRISSSSMEPTYLQGGHVTVRSVGTMPVRRGQVIAFSARDWGSDLVFLQRVIGVGGDRVSISPTGKVSINGASLSEAYLTSHGASVSGVPVSVTVPAGRLFLLGDHRAAAADSRAHLSEDEGTIARSAVLGVVVAHPVSHNRFWVWTGVAVAAAGMIAAAVAAAVRHRRTTLVPMPGAPVTRPYPGHAGPR